jgi:hypothetical protein
MFEVFIGVLRVDLSAAAVIAIRRPRCAATDRASAGVVASGHGGAGCARSNRCRRDPPRTSQRPAT